MTDVKGKSEQKLLQTDLTPAGMATGEMLKADELVLIDRALDSCGWKLALEQR